MAGRREQALALIAEFYRAPGSEAQWQHVFAELADLLRLQSVQLIELHLPSQANSVIRVWGFEDYWKKRYQQHYSAINPVMDRENTPHGIVYSTDAHIRKTWERSEYFNDFLVPQDNYYGCGGVGTLHGEVAQIWGLMWGRRNGEPRRGQRELVTRLVPHLANRLRIEQHIATLDEQKRSLQRALELLGAACAVLDARGRALWCNGPAERLLAAGDGLRLGRGGRLVARRPSCAAALRRSLSGALGIVAAEQHAVSLHTVRSQIRQLLDKTGCRRQTQLIASLYRSLGRLVR